MLHKPFRHLQDLLSGFPTYAEAYASFLQSGVVPPCLEDDVHRLEQQENSDQSPNDDEQETPIPTRCVHNTHHMHH